MLRVISSSFMFIALILLGYLTYDVISRAEYGNLDLLILFVSCLFISVSFNEIHKAINNG
jgi:TRAP-type C4-dicarboxylate transport system permease small subunit